MSSQDLFDICAAFLLTFIIAWLLVVLADEINDLFDKD